MGLLTWLLQAGKGALAPSPSYGVTALPHLTLTAGQHKLGEPDETTLINQLWQFDAD